MVETKFTFFQVQQKRMGGDPGNLMQPAFYQD